MNNLGMNQNIGMIQGQSNGVAVPNGINLSGAGNPQNMMMPNLPPNMNQLMSQNQHQHQQMTQNQQQQQQMAQTQQQQQQFLQSMAQNMPQHMQNANMMQHPQQATRSQSLPGNSMALPQQMMPNRQNNNVQRSSSMTGMGSNTMNQHQLGLGGFNSNSNSGGNSGMSQSLNPSNSGITNPSHNQFLQFQMMQQQQAQAQMGNNQQQQMQLPNPQQSDQQNFQQTQNQLMMQNNQIQNQMSQQQQIHLPDNSMNLNHAQKKDSMNGNGGKGSSNSNNNKRRLSNSAVQQQQQQIAAMKMKQQQMAMLFQMRQAHAVQQQQQNMSKQRQSGTLRQQNVQSQQLHRQQQSSSGGGNNSSRVSSSRSVNSGDSGNSAPQSTQPPSMQGIMGNNARMLQQNIFPGMQPNLPNNLNKMMGGSGGMNNNPAGAVAGMNGNVNGIVGLPGMKNNPQGGIGGLTNNGLALPSPPKTFGMNKNNNMGNNIGMNMNMGMNGNLAGMVKGQGGQQGRRNSGMDMMTAQQQFQALQQQQMQQAVQQQPTQQQMQAIQQVIQQQPMQSSRPMQGLPPPKMIHRTGLLSSDSNGMGRDDQQSNKRRRQNVIMPNHMERRGSNVSLPGVMTGGMQSINNMGGSGKGTNGNDRIDSVSPLFQQMHGMTQNQNQSQRLLPPPQQARRPSLKRMEKRSSISLSRDPNPHHNLMHAKDAKPLIESLPWEEKLIYLSRHVMGGRKGNGYFRAISTLNKMRRKLLKDSEMHGNKRSVMRRGGMGGLQKQNYDIMDESEAANLSDELIPGNVHPVKELKLLEKSPETAAGMLTEMGLGITFCNTIELTIESILSEIDPQDKDLKGRKVSKSGKLGTAMKKSNLQVTVKDPDPVFPDIEPIAIQDAAVDQEKMKALAQHMYSQSKPQIQPQSQVQTQIQNPPNSQATPAPPPNIQVPQPNTVSPSSSKSPLPLHNSQLRKERDKQMGIKKRKDPIEACAPANPDAKKLSKKDLAFRHLNLTRFRKLQRGEYVAVKIPNEDICTVARVVIDWVGPVIPPGELMTLTDSKRDSLFSSTVAILDVKYQADDLSNARMVNRQLVLPLPQNHDQGNEWLYRCRKGFKVYAMYPQTSQFYPATVVDNTTYCQGKDNICVVNFDIDDVDPTTGVPIQRHVPARLISLTPREFLPSKAKRRRSSLARRGSNSGGGARQSLNKGSASKMLQPSAGEPTPTVQPHPLLMQNAPNPTPIQHAQNQAPTMQHMMQPMHQPPLLRPTTVEENEQNDVDKTLMDMLDKMPLSGEMGGLDDLDGLDFGEEFDGGGGSNTGTSKSKSGNSADYSIFQQMASQTHEL